MLPPLRDKLVETCQLAQELSRVQEKNHRYYNRRTKTYISVGNNVLLFLPTENNIADLKLSIFALLYFRSPPEYTIVLLEFWK